MNARPMFLLLLAAGCSGAPAPADPPAAAPASTVRISAAPAEAAPAPELQASGFKLPV
jgi:hypothetical protein